MRHAGISAGTGGADAPVLVDARAVAETLSVGLSTVYRWADEGAVPHVRLGRSIAFDPVEVAHWAAQGGRPDARRTTTTTTTPDKAGT